MISVDERGDQDVMMLPYKKRKPGMKNLNTGRHSSKLNSKKRGG